MSTDLAARIAAAQLTGLSRVRTVVPAAPFTGLIKPGAPDFVNYVVARNPGEPVSDLGDSLDVLRAAFPPGPIRFELIDEACPGAVAALEAAGLTVIGRYPLLTLEVADLRMPPTPDGGTVEVAKTRQDAVDADLVASAAFGSPAGDPDAPGDPASGGSVLARIGGEPVAAAFWTAVADGVTEIAGVATLEAYRGRGLGALVTAAAVRAAVELTGVSLAWLTPGHDGADRIYRKVGFAPTAHAVHLATVS